MAVEEVIIPLPENIYVRLKRIAQATQQSLTDVLLRAVEVGSPPGWEDAPGDFQADLASLDRLNDEALWVIAKAHFSRENAAQVEELLDKRANQPLSGSEETKLKALQHEADRLMLRKSYAAAQLRWRGHIIPPPEKL